PARPAGGGAQPRPSLLPPGGVGPHRPHRVRRRPGPVRPGTVPAPQPSSTPALPRAARPRCPGPVARTPAARPRRRSRPRPGRRPIRGPVSSRPRLDREPVDLPVVFGALGAVWDGIVALADELSELPWTVVGGQMVFLHAAEAGVDVHRVSADIDAAVDL